MSKRRKRPWPPRAAVAAAKKRAGSRELRVSDHAVLRYLEREKGLDREATEAEILTDQLAAQVRALGGTGRFVSDGRRVIVEDYVIKTLYGRSDQQ